MALNGMIIVILVYSSSVDAGGFLCADVYLQEMWQQFCRLVPIHLKPDHWVINYTLFPFVYRMYTFAQLSMKDKIGKPPMKLICDMFPTRPV